MHARLTAVCLFMLMALMKYYTKYTDFDIANLGIVCNTKGSCLCQCLRRPKLIIAQNQKRRSKLYYDIKLVHSTFIGIIYYYYIQPCQSSCTILTIKFKTDYVNAEKVFSYQWMDGKKVRSIYCLFIVYFVCISIFIKIS